VGPSNGSYAPRKVGSCQAGSCFLRVWALAHPAAPTTLGERRDLAIPHGALARFYPQRISVDQSGGRSAGRTTHHGIRSGQWRVDRDDRTARHVATHKPYQLVHGFDVFFGLPESWASDPVGEYTQHGTPPQDIAPDNVQFHVGWLNETLPPFLADHPGQPVAAIHFDADLYSSTLTIEDLDLLATRMQPGCVVRFDEYYTLRAGTVAIADDFDQHEARAWEETMAKYGIETEPVSWHGKSVTFSVLENPSFRGYSDNDIDGNKTDRRLLQHAMIPWWQYTF
jgi:hypothetical protein